MIFLSVLEYNLYAACVRHFALCVLPSYWLCESKLLVFLGMHWLHSLVSVVSYWESFCSSYMSTSTLALAGPSITLLMFSLARASASRSPRPHTDWSSKIAAREAKSEGEIGEAEERMTEHEDGGHGERGKQGEE